MSYQDLSYQDLKRVVLQNLNSDNSVVLDGLFTKLTKRLTEVLLQSGGEIKQTVDDVMDVQWQTLCKSKHLLNISKKAARFVIKLF